MKLKTLLLILACAVSVLIATYVLTSCGGSLNGTYDLVKMSRNGQTMDKDQIEAAKQNGNEAALYIQDNSATFNIFGSVQTVSVNTETKTMTDSRGEQIQYILNGNTITLSDSSYTMVFEKR